MLRLVLYLYLYEKYPNIFTAGLNFFEELPSNVVEQSESILPSPTEAR